MLANDISAEAATMQALNEAFIIAAIFVASAIPAALKMKQEYNEE